MNSFLLSAAPSGLVHAHSGLRYIVLVLILIAIIKGFGGMKGGKTFTSGDKKIALFAMIGCHIQLLIGLVLYFMSPWVNFKNPMGSTVDRFFTVEHIVAMVLAIALITIGYSKSKKATTDQAKFKKIAVFFTLGLIIIFMSIPWPFFEGFRGFARPWA